MEALKLTKDRQSLWMFNFHWAKMAPDLQDAVTAYYNEQFELGRSLIEIYDDLIRSSAGWGKAPIGVGMSLLAFKVPLNLDKRKEILVAPVQGPFEVEEYEKEVFVESYVDQKYETRVQDIVEILRNVTGSVVAVGDGAGVAYAAAKIINEGEIVPKLVVTSYDPSSVMRRKAKALGNVVLDIPYEGINYDDFEVVFCSHVIEYLENDFVRKHEHRKLIFFESKISYAGCELLTPYKQAWQYQLATRNIGLYGVLLKRPLQVVSDKTLSVLGIYAAQEPTEIRVHESMHLEKAILQSRRGELPEKEGYIVRVNPYVDPCLLADAYYTPKLGILNAMTVSVKCVVAPVEMVTVLKGLGGYFSLNPLYCAKGNMMCKASKVQAYTGVAYTVLPMTIEGSYNVVKVPKCDYIMLTNCGCMVHKSHNHLLQVRLRADVEVANFTLDLRRMREGKSTTRQDVIDFVTRRCDFGMYKYQYYERLGKMIYDPGGYLQYRKL